MCNALNPTLRNECKDAQSMTIDTIAYTIREAGIHDAPEIARLNAAFNGSHEAAEAYAARFADETRVDFAVLALVGERAVGLANLRLVKPLFYPDCYAEITEMFVEEDFRRKGIGRALLAQAEEMARQAGARQMLILTDFYNDVAQSLYRAMGYTHYDIALSKELA